MRKQVIHTTKAAVTGAPWHQAIRFGDLMFCNKVVAGGFLDIDQKLPLLNEVWVRYFGENIPARTAIGVHNLRDNYLLEIEATATCHETVAGSGGRPRGGKMGMVR